MAQAFRTLSAVRIPLGIATCSRYMACGCCESLRVRFNSSSDRLKAEHWTGPRNFTTKADASSGRRSPYTRSDHATIQTSGTTKPIANSYTPPAYLPHLPLPPPLPYSPTSIPFLRHLSILSESLLSPSLSGVEESWVVWQGLDESLRGKVGSEVLGRLLERVVQDEGGQGLERCLEILRVARGDGVRLGRHSLEQVFLAGSRHVRARGNESRDVIAGVETTWHDLLLSIGGVAHLHLLSSETRVAFLQLRYRLDRSERVGRSPPSGSVMDIHFASKEVAGGLFQRGRAILALRLLAENGALGDIARTPVICKIILASNSSGPNPLPTNSTSPESTQREVKPTATRTEWEERARLLVWLRENGVEVAPEVRERVERSCSISNGGSTVERSRNFAAIGGPLTLGGVAEHVVKRKDETKPGANRQVVHRSIGSVEAMEAESQGSHIKALSLLLSTPFDPSTYLAGLKASTDFVLDPRHRSNVTIQTRLGQTELAEGLLAVMLEIHSRISAHGSAETKREAADTMASVVERFPGTLLGFGAGGWSRLVVECAVTDMDAQFAPSGASLATAVKFTGSTIPPAHRIYSAVRKTGLVWTESQADLEIWDHVTGSVIGKGSQAVAPFADALLRDALTNGVHLGPERIMPFVARAATYALDTDRHEVLERYLAIYRDESPWKPENAIPSELLSLVLITTRLPSLSDQMTLLSTLHRVFSPLHPSSTYSTCLSLLQAQGEVSVREGNFTSRWSDLAYELLVGSVNEDVTLNVEGWNTSIGMCLFGRGFEGYLPEGTGRNTVASAAFMPTSASRNKARVLYHLMCNPPSPELQEPADGAQVKVTETSGLAGPQDPVVDGISNTSNARVCPSPSGTTLSMFMEDLRRRDRRQSLRGMLREMGRAGLQPLRQNGRTGGSGGLGGISEKASPSMDAALPIPPMTGAAMSWPLTTSQPTVTFHPEVVRRVDADLARWKRERKLKVRLERSAGMREDECKKRDPGVLVEGFA